MNIQNIMTSSIKGLVSTGMIAMLVACGGGGGGGSDDNAATSESVVARGVITQLGSIWVLGVEYETPDGNSYSSDDSTSTVADYKVGQVVRLRGRRNNDGISGTADEVEYEAEIEGEASGDTIHGVKIVPTEITGFSSLVDGTRYEVSGLWLNDTTIEATFIKVDDDSDVVDEIKGYVTASTMITLTVHGLTYTYSGTPVVSQGDYVEVHFNGTVASLVELEDDYNDENEGQEHEIEGAVNKTPADLAMHCPPGSVTHFLIETTCIDWSSVPSNGWMDGLTDSDDLITGVRIEAEGHYNAAGVLVAEKIKGRGNRVRITSIAADTADDPNFKLFFGDIQVTTISGVTEYDLDNMGTSVDSIADDDGLEVRGIRTGPTSMLALRIKSENVDADRHELRAVVDSIDPILLPNGGADSSNNTITVMGVTAVAGADTELEIEDVQIAPVPPSSVTMEADIDSFLEMIDDDDIVNLTNGPNDVVDVRIDTTNSGTNSGDGSIVSPYEAVQIEIEEEDD